MQVLGVSISNAPGGTKILTACFIPTALYTKSRLSIAQMQKLQLFSVDEAAVVNVRVEPERENELVKLLEAQLLLRSIKESTYGETLIKLSTSSMYILLKVEKNKMFKILVFLIYISYDSNARSSIDYRFLWKVVNKGFLIQFC